MTSRIIIDHQKNHPTREQIKNKAMEALRKSGSQSKPTAQAVFSKIARVMGADCTRNAVKEFTAVKPIIRELVGEGLIKFRHVEGGTSFYIVSGVAGEHENSAHAPGEAKLEESWHFGDQEESETIHHKAGCLIASRRWKINTDRLELATEKLREGYMYKNGEWKPVKDDQEGYKVQCYQVKAIARMRESLGNVVSFDVHCDDRGRFNVGGGYASPYQGKLNRWIYTGTDEISLDHRTSFSQIYALITGSDWGKHSGIGNAHPVDFWDGVLSQWGAHVKPHSTQRQGCKAYGTPCTYGAGKPLARQKGFPLIDEAVATGEITREEGDATKNALEQFADTIGEFAERCRSYASSFTQWGEFPKWETPSGFLACKKYFHTTQVVWNSGENDTTYYPKSMTFTLRTGRICEQPKEGSTDHSVLVATTANLVQSIDASIMANVVVRYHQETGNVLFPMHDAYIVPREDKELVTRIVIDVLREIADCPQIRQIRRELGLPPVNVVYGTRTQKPGKINLDMREMNPLEEE